MTITLTLKNRSAKTPIKNLPSTIQISDTTTVEDVKKVIALKVSGSKKGGGWRQIGNLVGGGGGGADPYRYGLFDPEKRVNLRDRMALIVDVREVMEGGVVVLVGDFGLQISWRNLYIIEYLGPILIHLIFPTLIRPWLLQHKLPLPSPYEKLSYPFYTLPSAGTASTSTPAPAPAPAPTLTPSQTLARTLIIIHFLKRELETIFLHKFSAASMPIRFIPKNCGHYWGLAGVVLAYFIYSPTSSSSSLSPPSSPLITTLNLLGLLLFLLGQVMNFRTHVILAKLRTRGTTERGIPHGAGFGWVTCPNYGWELVSWMGVLAVTRSVATLLFMGVGGTQMVIWGRKKEGLYRREFGGGYGKKRWVVVPGVV